MNTQRSNRTNPLALFSAILCVALVPLFVTGCNNPSSSPSDSANSGLSDASYAGALSLSDTLRPTLSEGLCAPSPFLFPADYIQKQLGLSDYQTAEIARIQDSIKLAFRTAMEAQKANGQPNRDSVLAIVQQFKTSLEAAITPLLTAAELTALQALQPPAGMDRGGRDDHGRRGPDHDKRPDHDSGVRPPMNDSLALVRLTQELGLTDAQIVSIKAVADSLKAEATLTPQGRHDAFKYQMTVILTAEQLAKFEAMEQREHGQGGRDPRRGRHR